MSDYSKIIQEIAAGGPEDLLFAIEERTGIAPQSVKNNPKEQDNTSPILYKNGNIYDIGKRLEALDKKHFMTMYYYDPGLNITLFGRVEGITWKEFSKTCTPQEFYGIFELSIKAFNVMIQAGLVHTDFHLENVLVVLSDQPIETCCGLIHYYPVIIDYSEVCEIESEGLNPVTELHLFFEVEEMSVLYPEEEEEGLQRFSFQEFLLIPTNLGFHEYYREILATIRCLYQKY